MAEKQIVYVDASGDRFVQAGIRHDRAPNGDFIGDPTPIYIRIRSEEEVAAAQRGELAKCEKNMLNGIASLFASKHREYVHGVKAIMRVNRLPVSATSSDAVEMDV